MTSSPIFSNITRHWPKIATGIVVSVGILEFVVGGLTSDSTIEFYFLAWGSITAGIWFLFDKAENTASESAKDAVSNWIKSDSLEQGINKLPEMFANLFDWIFGSRHLSLLCFRRSLLVSIVSSWIVGALLVGVGAAEIPEQGVLLFGAFALFINVIPDYFSLLQTRFMIDIVRKHGWPTLILVLDALITALIFLVFVIGGFYLISSTLFPSIDIPSNLVSAPAPIYDNAFAVLLMGDLLDGIFLAQSNSGAPTFLGVLFVTTFFTSIWLWLYLISIGLSRALLKLNNGLGFLIKVVDVESQPFRSLGFVSILLVSILFLLGLPFVF